jgi:outer membrane protein TolC
MKDVTQAAVFLSILFIAPKGDAQTTTSLDPPQDLPQSLSQPLSVAQCIRLAQASLPTQRTQQGRLHAAEAQLTQARTWPNPIYTYTAQDIALQTASGAPLLLQQHTLSFQPLFAYAKQQEASVARANLERTAATLDEERRQISLAVGRAYYDVLLAARLATVEEQAVAAAHELVIGTELRVGRGDAGQLEVTRAHAEELEARRSAELWLRRSELGELALSIALGATMPQRLQLIEDWSGGSLPLPVSVRAFMAQPEGQLESVRPALRAMALRQRPELRQAAAELRQAEEQRQAELRRTIPLADLQVSVAARITAVGTGALVAASAPVSIFDWNQGPRRRALAQNEIARAAQMRSERQVLLDVDSALLDWQRANQALGHRVRPLVQARELALAATRRQFQAGVVSLLDVITAQRDLLAARRLETQSSYESALALLQLAMALAVPVD